MIRITMIATAGECGLGGADGGATTTARGTGVGGGMATTGGTTVDDAARTSTADSALSA
jgi:hypothetical protein